MSKKKLCKICFDEDSTAFNRCNACKQYLCTSCMLRVLRTCDSGCHLIFNCPFCRTQGGMKIKRCTDLLSRASNDTTQIVFRDRFDYRELKFARIIDIDTGEDQFQLVSSTFPKTKK